MNNVPTGASFCCRGYVPIELNYFYAFNLSLLTQHADRCIRVRARTAHYVSRSKAGLASTYQLAWQVKFNTRQV